MYTPSPLSSQYPLRECVLCKCGECIQRLERRADGALLVIHGHNEDRPGQWVVTTLADNMVFVYPESFEQAAATLSA